MVTVEGAPDQGTQAGTAPNIGGLAKSLFRAMLLPIDSGEEVVTREGNDGRILRRRPADWAIRERPNDERVTWVLVTIAVLTVAAEVGALLGLW